MEFCEEFAFIPLSFPIRRLDIGTIDIDSMEKLGYAKNSRSFAPAPPCVHDLGGNEAKGSFGIERVRNTEVSLRQAGHK